MKVKEMREEVELPEGVQASVDGKVLTVTGPKGSVKRSFDNPHIEISMEGNKVVLVAKDATKREKRMVYTYRSHIRNMARGCAEGHVYKLKVCSGHFPMNVSLSNNQIVIKNFLGEKVPRTVSIKDGADVKVEGDIITVESADKELAGQVAADIEQLTRITNRDRRIFQDGIYIISKSGRDI